MTANDEWILRSRRRDKWTQAWRIEQLTQLKADVESAWHRYMVECLRAQNDAPDADKEQWIVAARMIEENGRMMMAQIDQWIETCCKEKGT